MRNFDYRSPRFPVDLPVHIVVQDSVLIGHCTDIGHGGMRVETPETIPVDLQTVIQVGYRGMHINIPARVIHHTAASKGVQFLCESDAQRQDVMRLIELLGLDSEESTSTHRYRQDAAPLSPWTA